jgi:phosphoribosylanthranilate isomerase
MKIKVCCISSLAEARLALDSGAWALGLVSAMPSGPGVIDEARIAEIVASVPAGSETFLLSCSERVEALVAEQRRTGVTTLQLVDRIEAGGHSRLRAELPGVRLVQVIHVTGPAAIDEALELAPLVDALLLDSGNPGLAVKELGGTGRRHDWATSAELVRRVDVPVFLAGGLAPENVGEAIRTVRPYGVDVCSGLRTDGALDAGKLRRFVKAVREAA